MTGFTTFASIAAGLICFGESLGRSAPITALHALAIAVVLPCVRPLAAAQAQLEDTLAQAAPADARHSRGG